MFKMSVFVIVGKEDFSGCKYMAVVKTLQITQNQRVKNQSMISGFLDLMDLTSKRLLLIRKKIGLNWDTVVGFKGNYNCRLKGIIIVANQSS